MLCLCVRGNNSGPFFAFGMTVHCLVVLLQDLVGMAVVRHGSTEAIGKVVDIYDGTGGAWLQFSKFAVTAGMHRAALH